MSSGIERGRVLAEERMTDTGTMRRQGGHVTQDASTGAESRAFTDAFTSKCKIQTSGLQASAAEVGGREAVTLRVELHLPVSAPAVEVGDVFEVTSLGSLSDLQLLGRKFRVTSPAVKSQATARRLQVEEVVS